MEGSTLVIFIICGVLTLSWLFDFFVTHKYSDGPKGVVRSLLKPVYYFFGYECDICHKVYLFNSHKAFMCCPGSHNNWGKGWSKTNPPPKNLGPKLHAHPCSHCGGTGRINGVACGWCDGLGKTFFDI